MCGFLLRATLGFNPTNDPDGERVHIWQPTELFVLHLDRRTNLVRVQIVGSSDVKLRLRLCSTYGKMRKQGCKNTC